MNVYFRNGRFDFVWDEAKAAANVVKHGISFEEATEVFLDPLAEYIDAVLNEEDRVAMLGTSESGNLLYVVHIEYEQGAIRLISAREASRRERQTYEDHA